MYMRFTWPCCAEGYLTDWVGCILQVDDSAPELTQEAVDILHALDFRVASDPVLFTKVVRVLGLSLGRHLGPMAPPESTPQIAEVTSRSLLADEHAPYGQVCHPFWLASRIDH